MTGGVSHVDTFDHKPKLFADHGKITAASAAGSALETAAVCCGRAGSSGRAASAAPRSATCSRTCASSMDDICLIRSMTHRPQRALPGHAGHAHRLVHLRPAEHRLLGQLRPGHGEPEPAVVRRHRAALALRRRRRSGRTDFLPGCHQGTRVVPGPEPIANVQPPRRRRPSCSELELGLADAFNRRAPEAQRHDARAGGPDPLVRDRLRHAARGARGLRPVEGDRRDAASSTAWSAARPRASPGSAWSAAGWPSAACASSS